MKSFRTRKNKLPLTVDIDSISSCSEVTLEDTSFRSFWKDCRSLLASVMFLLESRSSFLILVNSAAWMSLAALNGLFPLIKLRTLFCVIEVSVFT